jgi:4a-hydroxytetrahydrobiopterin dehydratase
MICELAAKVCTPCKGGIPPLTAEQAETYRKQTPEWTIRGDPMRIERQFAFPDFRAALDFVNRVGDLAETEGHHPDLRFGWGYCSVELYTHKIKGLHENDFIMAAKIDRFAGG